MTVMFVNFEHFMFSKLYIMKYEYNDIVKMETSKWVEIDEGI